MFLLLIECLYDVSIMQMQVYDAAVTEARHDGGSSARERLLLNHVSDELKHSQEAGPERS